MSDVIVVGAGIVGLSTAFWLKRAGHRVTVVEKGPIPNPHASSSDHHRLIRYPYKDAEGYCARITQAFEAWRAMWADLPNDEPYYYAATQILCVSQHEGDYTDVSSKVMDRLSIPYERVENTNIPGRFPFLEAANLAYATLSEGGAVMANRILSDLVIWLRRQGVLVMEYAPVVSVDMGAGVVTLENGTRLSADRVVISTGVATAALLPDLDLPLVPHRTVIAYVQPPEDLAEAYAGMPCWNDLGGDTDLWGMPAIDGIPMKLGCGTMGRREPTVSEREMGPEEVRILLRHYAARLRGAERFCVLWHYANYWTAAPNSEFFLRAEGRTLVVSACSGHGFKFGALSGRDVAEAVGGTPVAKVAERMAARVAV